MLPGCHTSVALLLCHSLPVITGPHSSEKGSPCIPALLAPPPQLASQVVTGGGYSTLLLADLFNFSPSLAKVNEEISAGLCYTEPNKFPGCNCATKSPSPRPTHCKGVAGTGAMKNSVVRGETGQDRTGTTVCPDFSGSQTTAT